MIASVIAQSEQPPSTAVALDSARPCARADATGASKPPNAGRDVSPYPCCSSTTAEHHAQTALERVKNIRTIVTLEPRIIPLPSSAYISRRSDVHAAPPTSAPSTSASRSARGYCPDSRSPLRSLDSETSASRRTIAAGVFADVAPARRRLRGSRVAAGAKRPDGLVRHHDSATCSPVRPASPLDLAVRTASVHRVRALRAVRDADDRRDCRLRSPRLLAVDDGVVSPQRRRSEWPTIATARLPLRSWPVRSPGTLLRSPH